MAGAEDGRIKRDEKKRKGNMSVGRVLGRCWKQKREKKKIRWRKEKKTSVSGERSYDKKRMGVKRFVS